VLLECSFGAGSDSFLFLVLVVFLVGLVFCFQNAGSRVALVAWGNFLFFLVVLGLKEEDFSSLEDVDLKINSINFKELVLLLVCEELCD